MAIGFRVDGDAVFHDEVRLRGVDAASFVALNTLYGKDALHAWTLAGKLAGADVASFEALGRGMWHEEWGRSPGYFRQGYAADQRAVWHYVLTIGKPSELRGVDRRSFRLLRFGYARDDRYVYWERSRLKKADPDSLEQLSQAFSRDRERVFYFDREIAGADRASFQPLEGFAARDARRVYLRNEAIPDADPASFELLGCDFIARDARHVFAHGQIFDGADVATFEFVGAFWYRDARRVYYAHRVVEGADPGSFRLLPDGAEDRFGRLRGGVRVKE